MNSLKRALEEHPEFYLDEFQAYIYNDLGHAPSRATIHRLLRFKLNYRLLRACIPCSKARMCR